MKQRDESGAVILESAFCILVTILMLVFLISFGFFLYQNAVVTIVANELAEELSQTYKLKDVPNSNSVTEQHLSDIGRYRYGGAKAGKLQSRNCEKAESQGNGRIKQTSMADNETKLKVNVKMVVDDIGRHHFEVTVSQRYRFLLGGILSLVGRKDAEVISRTVYVEGSDMLHMVNSVKKSQYFIEEISGRTPGTVDNLLSAIHSLEEMIRALVG